MSATNHEVAARIVEFWGRAHWTGLAVFAAIWLAALAVLLITAFSVSRLVRVLWSLPIALSAFLGHLAYSITGHHLAFYDVVLYASEQAHWGDVLRLYSSWIESAVAWVGVGLLGFWLPPRRALRIPLGSALAPALPLGLIAGLLLGEAGKGTRALPEQFSPLTMLLVAAVQRPFQSTSPREIVASGPEQPPLTEDVFLVIDESVRADFIDPNGARGVTPFLASRSGEFANFGYAVSGNNCSLFSNLILRYGGTPESLTQTLRSGPSIWAWAHAAGFRTVYIDAQLEGGRLQNGMTLGERNEIDELIQLEAPITERDERAADLLATFSRDGTRTFALVNKWGSHFPYAQNYPADAAPFQPAMAPDEPIGGDRERLLGAYRNSVLWTTDRFFERLLKADVGASALIYTSDHGQNLLERGVVTHCSAVDPYPLEGVVPLLVLAGPAELRERFSHAAARGLDRASHFEIFPTLLELFGFDPARRARYGPSLLDPRRDESARGFTYGPVIGPAREPLWRVVSPELIAGTRAQSGRP